MRLPHHDDVPYRRTIVIWVCVLCVAVGAAWPGQSVAERFTDIAVALLSFATCYGFTRLTLGGLVALAHEHYDGVPLWCLLLVFYGGILATCGGLITAPFQWHDVHQGGATATEILAALPSGLYTSAAALKTIEKYYPRI